MATGVVQRDPREPPPLEIPDIEALALAYGELGPPETVRAELDLINRTLHGLWKLEPDLALRTIGGLSTRVTEIARLLHRVESHDRAYTRIRTMDANPVLEECDRQYKIAKGLVSVRDQDIRIGGLY